MKLEEIFNDKHLLLPKAIPTGETYRSFLNELYRTYISLLRKISPKTINIPGLKRPINLAKIIEIQEEFINGIKDTIELYFDGQPAIAYNSFAKVIEYRTGKYKKILNIGDFEEDENFYRIRKTQENFPLSSLEMFHIPFEARGKVSTQRYSIPGFPSLYLGKTLYVAWEELKRPSLDNFQAVRLVSKKPIRYLDLTTNDWGSSNLNNNAYKYLMTWPLIAACSIKVKDYSDTFKPEYIIPQLLLQWIRNTGEIDGIKYNSTHINRTELIGKGELYNLVIPVKENKDQGYCKHLAGLFKITETISKQLLEHSTGGRGFMYTKSEFERIDQKIPKLEIIKGHSYPYSYSILGQMEMTLDSMDIKSMNQP